MSPFLRPASVAAFLVAVAVTRCLGCGEGGLLVVVDAGEGGAPATASTSAACFPLPHQDVARVGEDCVAGACDPGWGDCDPATPGCETPCPEAGPCCVIADAGQDGG